MTSADRQTLARKLNYLHTQLDALAPYQSLTRDELLATLERRLAVERMLELSIQSVIDVSRLAVAVQGWRKPGDERDTLLNLAERGILDGELAARLLRAKGFRNILVHDYVAIDPDLLVLHLRDDAGDLWAFAQAVARWLKESEGRE